MNPEKKIPEHQIESEDGKLWVNGKYNCLGRFTPNGYEIYREFGVETDVIGTSATLSCRVHNTDEKDWRNFKQLMLENHNIDLKDTEYPHEN